MGIHSKDAVSEALSVMQELSEYLKKVHEQEGSEGSPDLLFLSKALKRLSRQNWSCYPADQYVQKKVNFH